MNYLKYQPWSWLRRSAASRTIFAASGEENNTCTSAVKEKLRWTNHSTQFIYSFPPFTSLHTCWWCEWSRDGHWRRAPTRPWVGRTWWRSGCRRGSWWRTCRRWLSHLQHSNRAYWNNVTGNRRESRILSGGGFTSWLLLAGECIIKRCRVELSKIIEF